MSVNHLKDSDCQFSSTAVWEAFSFLQIDVFTSPQHTHCHCYGLLLFLFAA